MGIDEIIELLHYYMPKKAIWMGWSMGGLIANRFALYYPENILSVINVTSSPCFIEKENWPGIKKNIAYKFYVDLKTNYYQTISDFLNLNTMNSKMKSKDLKLLKKILFSQDKPNKNILKNNLEIIFLVDLRLDITFLKVPLLRIYGSLDPLIPKKIISILDKKWPKTHSVIIEKAAHIPFVSHEQEFCHILLNFINLL